MSEKNFAKPFVCKHEKLRCTRCGVEAGQGNIPVPKPETSGAMIELIAKSVGPVIAATMGSRIHDDSLRDLAALGFLLIDLGGRIHGDDHELQAKAAARAFAVAKIFMNARASCTPARPSTMDELLKGSGG